MGDWSNMFISGKNGFASILACLVALLMVLDDDEWARCMLDVQWVVQEVLVAVKEFKCVSFSLDVRVLMIVAAAHLLKRVPRELWTQLAAVQRRDHEPVVRGTSWSSRSHAATAMGST